MGRLSWSCGSEKRVKKGPELALPCPDPEHAQMASLVGLELLSSEEDRVSLLKLLTGFFCDLFYTSLLLG